MSQVSTHLNNFVIRKPFHVSVFWHLFLKKALEVAKGIITGALANVG
jgi:hypothetical protein